MKETKDIIGVDFDVDLNQIDHVRKNILNGQITTFVKGGILQRTMKVRLNLEANNLLHLTGHSTKYLKDEVEKLRNQGST